MRRVKGAYLHRGIQLSVIGFQSTVLVDSVATVAMLSESRIVTDYTDYADWFSWCDVFNPVHINRAYKTFQQGCLARLEWLYSSYPFVKIRFW